MDGYDIVNEAHSQLTDIACGSDKSFCIKFITDPCLVRYKERCELLNDSIVVEFTIYF